jgi:transmembrane sensor
VDEKADPIPVDDASFTAAVRWMLRRRDPSWSVADEERFRDWLAADPQHAAALREVDACEQMAGAALVEQTSAHRPSSRGGHRWLLAAALLLVGVATGWWSLVHDRNPQTGQPEQAVLHATMVGERRTVRLPDGSRAELDADSQIQWVGDPAGEHRRVLLDRGRAVFTVASDAEHPLLVTAGIATVRVTGTVFTVDLRLEEVAVRLQEGAVQVERLPRFHRAVGELATLRPGQEAVIGKHIELGYFEPQDFAAWREGRLVFRDRSLHSVLAELRRYHDEAIEVAPAVTQRRLTGTVRSGPLRAQLAAVAAALNLRLVAPPTGGWRLEP